MRRRSALFPSTSGSSTGSTSEDSSQFAIAQGFLSWRAGQTSSDPTRPSGFACSAGIVILLPGTRPCNLEIARCTWWWFPGISHALQFSFERCSSVLGTFLSCSLLGLCCGPPCSSSVVDLNLGSLQLSAAVWWRWSLAGAPLCHRFCQTLVSIHNSDLDLSSRAP